MNTEFNPKGRKREMMCEAKRLKKPFNHKRISLLFPVFILLAALWLGGCAKDSGVSSVAEPERSSAALVTEVPETTAALPETSLEISTEIQEPTTTVQETTTAEPAVAPSEFTTAIPETTELIPESTPALPEDSALIRRRGGDPAGEIIGLLPLPEIPYERPDMEGLFADMDALAVQVGTTDDVRAVINTYKDIRNRMMSARTMANLAYFRYSQDATSSYYNEESEYTAARIVDMDNKHSELIQTMADSPLRSGLESAYFGHRYFDYNSKNRDEDYQKLSLRENELRDQYLDLTAVPKVSYQGEEKTLNEWIESESDDIRRGAISAYLDAYYEPLGQTFLELVKVRQQLAASMGYQDYMRYAFQSYHGYSSNRAGTFFERVRTHLVPVLKAFCEENPNLILDMDFPASLQENPMGHLAIAAEAMGGIIWEAYRFMDVYDLYDVDTSPVKRRGGYTGYLPDYEAPFVYGYGKFNLLSHEFGHFAHLYHDYGTNRYADVGEVFSTAMEYLSIFNDSSLSQEERAAGLRTVLAARMLLGIIVEAALADFELRVYEREPDNLTLEDLEEMHNQCQLDYGLDLVYSETMDRREWIVQHLFTHPGYVIAYSLANVTSLQISRLETNEPGAGVAAFGRLLGVSTWADIEAATRNAKLQSPFASDTLKRIAAFLREALELPQEEE